MSKLFNVDHVTEVLLDDGWHPVEKDTFEIDSLGGATWMESESENRWCACPLAQIKSVRYSPR
jgi:hypothetical protein